MSFCNFRVFWVKEYCGCFMPKMPRVRHESRGISVEQIDHYGGSYGPFPPTLGLSRKRTKSFFTPVSVTVRSQSIQSSPNIRNTEIHSSHLRSTPVQSKTPSNLITSLRGYAIGLMEIYSHMVIICKVVSILIPHLSQ